MLKYIIRLYHSLSFKELVNDLVMSFYLRKNHEEIKNKSEIANKNSINSLFLHIALKYFITIFQGKNLKILKCDALWYILVHQRCMKIVHISPVIGLFVIESRCVQIKHQT